MAQQRVRILCHGGKAVVVPAYACVEPGDELVFEAIDTDATLLFADPTGLEENGTTTKNSHKLSKMTGKKFKVMPDEKEKYEAAKSAYSNNRANPDKKKAVKDKWSDLHKKVTYAVYCGDHGFAEGNSSPVIIIEPPDPIPPD